MKNIFKIILLSPTQSQFSHDQYSSSTCHNRLSVSLSVLFTANLSLLGFGSISISLPLSVLSLEPFQFPFYVIKFSQHHTYQFKILIPTQQNFHCFLAWASFISLSLLIISPKFQSFSLPNLFRKTHPSNPRHPKQPKISPNSQSFPLRKSVHPPNSNPVKENPVNLPHIRSFRPPKSIETHNTNPRHDKRPIISQNSQSFSQADSLKPRSSLKLRSCSSKGSVQGDYPSSNITMKVHPLPNKKRNMTVQFSPLIGDRQAVVGSGSNKKLRRLPHIFSRVLELPFRSDAEVEVEESPEFFRFVAETDGVSIGCDVRAHTVEIHPGVTKIVVRPNGCVELLSLDQLELDMWRFRLPDSTRPELASAVCVDGELIVTVPKVEDAVDGGDGEVWGTGGNRLVLYVEVSLQEVGGTSSFCYFSSIC